MEDWAYGGSWDKENVKGIYFDIFLGFVFERNCYLQKRANQILIIHIQWKGQFIMMHNCEPLIF